MTHESVKFFSKKWGVSERRIVALCNAGRIPGANKIGNSWTIPANANHPLDGRVKFADKDAAKTIAVAGINSEIGVALAEILIGHGYKIIGLAQAGSKIHPALSRPEITMYRVDFANRADLIKTCAKIDKNLAGFVFMEIYFHLEDALSFDYEQFEKSYFINVFAPNILVREFIGKMNYQSSVVIVNSIEAYRGSFGASAYASAQAAKENLVKTFSNIFTEMYGVRINSLMAGWIGGVMESDDAFNKSLSEIPMKRLGHPAEIADDIFLLLTRHKYMTGASLISDGGYLSVDVASRTEDMSSGKFYKWLHRFFTEARAGDNFWIISTMMDNEWNEDPNETEFRNDNLTAANNGVNLERIYLFRRKDAKKFRNNPSISVFMKNKNMNNMFVDIDDLSARHPEIMKIIGNGWIGINDKALLIDLPSGENGESRGYVSMNKSEIVRARAAFEKIKSMATGLGNVL